MVRWAGECVDVFAIKIRQLIGLAVFEGAGMEKLTKLVFVTGFPNTISLELQVTKYQRYDYGGSTGKSEGIDDDRRPKPGHDCGYALIQWWCHTSRQKWPLRQCNMLQAQMQRTHGKKLLEAWDTLLPMWRGWPLGSRLSGTRGRGQGISASLLPNEDLNTTLPVANIYINGTQCLVLVDTGCS